MRYCLELQLGACLLLFAIIVTAALYVNQTAKEICRQQPDACLEAFQVDMSSYRSIKKFETSLNQWIRDSNLEPSIQLLINNAGMLAKSQRITEDGIDEYVLSLQLFLWENSVVFKPHLLLISALCFLLSSQFSKWTLMRVTFRVMQTNYIGPFILTSILLPLLKNSPVPSRVVNLTSFTHRCGKFEVFPIVYSTPTVWTFSQPMWNYCWMDIATLCKFLYCIH